MAQHVAPPTATTPALPAKLPIGAIAPWAVFFGILMLVLLYDARHLLGFPCH
jgi:hypothetical protein